MLDYASLDRSSCVHVYVAGNGVAQSGCRKWKSLPPPPGFPSAMVCVPDALKAVSMKLTDLLSNDIRYPRTRYDDSGVYKKQRIGVKGQNGVA